MGQCGHGDPYSDFVSKLVLHIIHSSVSYGEKHLPLAIQSFLLANYCYCAHFCPHLVHTHSDLCLLVDSVLVRITTVQWNHENGLQMVKGQCRIGCSSECRNYRTNEMSFTAEPPQWENSWKRKQCCAGSCCCLCVWVCFVTFFLFKNQYFHPAAVRMYYTVQHSLFSILMFCFSPFVCLSVCNLLVARYILRFVTLCHTE